MSLTLAPLPSYQCYDCRGCGICCRGIFAIGLQADERDRIEAQGWGDDPAMAGKTLFITQGSRTLLAHDAQGACVLLDAHGRCRIHAKFGEPAKPLACRLYPFKFIPAGTQARTDIRFDCPAVAANEGRPLREHREAAKVLLPLTAVDAVEPPPFCGKTRLSWAQLDRVTATFSRLLRHSALDLTQRIVACVNVAAALGSMRISSLDDGGLRELLEAAFAKVTATASEETMVRLRPLLIERAAFRQVLAVYGREDRRGESGVMWGRLTTALRMLAGSGVTPPLRPDFPAVPFAALEEPLGIPPDEVMAPLIRYYRFRLESLGFFGAGFYGFDYLDGLNALLLTYPITLWFARLFALGRDMVFPDQACMEQALQVVNHAHGVVPIFRLPQERTRLRFLGERTTLRRLVVWYGR